MESLTLANETIEAEVLPGLGARLHRLRAFGHDLLRTPPDLTTYAREPFFWGSYPMAPWCNRVSTERTVVGTRVVALTPNFPDGSAIHGQVYRAAWETDDGMTDTSRHDPCARRRGRMAVGIRGGPVGGPERARRCRSG